MIKRLLFFFSAVAAVDHTDCRLSTQPGWVCDYMQKHGKLYHTHSELKLRHYRLQSVQQEEHGKAQFGLTSRSDRFSHELRNNNAFVSNVHHSLERSKRQKHEHKEGLSIFPTLDWRLHNRVSPVKDQGECGGCFAFASASVLEFWSGNHPKSISAQNLMDCTSGSGRPNVDCDGGLMEYVFEYAKQHPVVLEQTFPFREREESCPSGQLLSEVAVHDYRVLMIDENPKAEQQLEYILHHYGPVAVGIDSTQMDNYRSGLYPGDRCSNDIDHAVTIVGYTKDAWIIKNSWGSGWGVNGYLYLERGSNACGIAEYMVYVNGATPIHQKRSTKWHMDAD